MSYPGGKSASGAYQKLINLIPPHEVYIETHLGGGAILLNKKAASVNIGIDIDAEVIQCWSGKNLPINLYRADAIQFIEKYNFSGNEFIYADPPYLIETLKSKCSPYRFVYSIEQHEKLLALLKTLPCSIMISGYWSELYATSLKDWQSLSFQLKTRSGNMANEWVWMNYPIPNRLHDYRYLGEDFRERERIKRKQARWVTKLRHMTTVERQALLSAIQSESDRGWL